MPLRWTPPSMKFLLHALWQHFIHSKLESVLSCPAAAFSVKGNSYCKSFVVIPTTFTASPPGADSTSRNHFLWSSISSHSQPLTSYQEIAATQSPLQAPIWIQVLCFHPICCYFLHSTLEPSVCKKCNKLQSPLKQHMPVLGYSASTTSYRIKEHRSNWKNQPVKSTLNVSFVTFADFQWIMCCNRNPWPVLCTFLE